MSFSYSNEELNYIWLSDKMAMGSRRLEQLVRDYGSAAYVAENYYDIHKENPQLLTVAEAARMSEESMEQYIARITPICEPADVRIVSRISAEYPQELRQTRGTPNVLYVRGTLPKPTQTKVAIVGSRKCTSYGEEVTKSIASNLAAAGVCVVSGMAYGIDTAAAVNALEFSNAPVATVAVLAGGVDHIYPESNEGLYYKIIEHGAVISQFQPGSKIAPRMFPARNMVIAAYAAAVIVTEAGDDSGSLITARYAHSIGRQVYSVPGRISDIMSRGTNTIINEGIAVSFISTNEVLDFLKQNKNTPKQKSLSDYAQEDTPRKTKAEKADKTEKTDKTEKENYDIALDGDEKVVYNILREGEKSFEEMCAITGFSVAQINLVLTSLEFSSIIKQSPGRVYSLI